MFIWRSKAVEVSRVRDFNENLIVRKNLLFRTKQQALTRFRIKRGRLLKPKQNDELSFRFAQSALVLEVGRKNRDGRRHGVIFEMSKQQYRADLREPEGKQDIKER